MLSTHVLFACCQTCLLSHDAMISHNIEAISLILFAYCLLLELYCFHNLPTQQYTIWPSFKHYMEYHQVCLLVEPWIHFSLHNPQVYAITQFSVNTQLVRSLIVLSLNLTKPTKGLDALT